MKIPVIINNRDLLTWPRAMVERISRYTDVGDIIIIDNESTYPPLLEWYNTQPCTVLQTKNFGHRAPWDLGLIRQLNAEYYVVTDPDLDLSGTPDDTLLYLKEKLIDSTLYKIGLMLDWEAVKPGMLYYDYLNWYERSRREMSPVINDVATKVQVDTTFAIYPREVTQYFVGGGSVFAPYQAVHLPWLYTRETLNTDAEYQYYLQNASTSASIKAFLKDKTWVKE